MKLSLIFSVLLAIGGVCSSKANANPSLVPGAKQLIVPKDIIQELPKKIQALKAVQGMNEPIFLEKLGLLEYRSNVSRSVRFSSYPLKLDDSHVLMIRCTIESLRIRAEDIEWALGDRESPMPKGGCRLTGEGLRVVGCTLVKNHTEVLAHRWFFKSKTRKAKGDESLPKSEG